MRVMGTAMHLFTAMSTLGQAEEVRQQERIHGPDGTIVVLSDVHLDKTDVVEKLATLFDGFQNLVSLPLFVLMGNFCSAPCHPKTMMGYLDELAQLVAKATPRLAEEARFVLVPGPEDPGLEHVLPRPPLPPSLRASLEHRIHHIHFATNPCRLRYFSKELVIFRQNMVSQLRRSCLWQTDSESTPVQHAVKTMLDQGHLCPIANKPIHWQYDHVLRLYPLPDAVILSDQEDQFYENYAECDVVNPGPFDKDFSFLVYHPVVEGQTKSDVEFSQVSC